MGEAVGAILHSLRFLHATPAQNQGVVIEPVAIKPEWTCIEWKSQAPAFAGPKKTLLCALKGCNTIQPIQNDRGGCKYLFVFSTMRAILNAVKEASYFRFSLLRQPNSIQPGFGASAEQLYFNAHLHLKVKQS